MGQRVGLKHTLQDEDVVQIMKGRFSITKKNDPDRISDRVKKAKLKT
jgi:hypothetical protein